MSQAFVLFNVPAEWQPFVELAMMKQEHLPPCTTKIATVKSIFSWMCAMIKIPNPKEYPSLKLQSCAWILRLWSWSRSALRFWVLGILWVLELGNWSLIVVQPAVMRVTAATAGTAFFAAHEIAEQVAHVLLDLLRVLAG